MHQFGKVDGALLYAQLFCLRFVEIEGSILLDRIPDLEKRYLDTKTRAALSLQEIEESFNVVEVTYLFSNRGGLSNGEGDLLAEFIAEAWRARLAYLYSPRKFNVYVLSSEQTNSVAEVRFFEVR